MRACAEKRGTGGTVNTFGSDRGSILRVTGNEAARERYDNSSEAASQRQIDEQRRTFTDRWEW